MSYLIVAVAGVVLAFFLGIVVGIADCKRRFDIPKGEMPIT